jgi:hypothetical protein
MLAMVERPQILTKDIKFITAVARIFHRPTARSLLGMSRFIVSHVRQMRQMIEALFEMLVFRA